MGERELVTKEELVEELKERKEKRSEEKRAKEKKRKRKERIVKIFNLSNIFAAFMAAAALIITLVMVFVGNVFEENYVIKAGDISKERFIANFQMVNRIATEKKIDLARQNEKPLYKKDANITLEAVENIESYFSSIQQAKQRQSSIDEAQGNPEKEEIEINVELDSTESSSQGNSDIEGTLEIPLFLNEEKYQMLLEMEDLRLTALKKDIIDIVVDVMDLGVTEDKLSAAINNAKDKIDRLSWSLDIKDIAYSIANTVIQPNTFIDEEATQKAIERAVLKVEPVIIKKGEKIVDKDEVITEEIYAILEDAGYIQQKEWSIKEAIPLLGGTILFLILEIFVCVYLNSMENEKWVLTSNKKYEEFYKLPAGEEKSKNKSKFKEKYKKLKNSIKKAWEINKNKAMIFTAYIIVLVLVKIMSNFHYTVMPAALLGMFSSLLISLPAAIVLNLVMSIVGAVICGGNIQAFLYFLVSGSCASIYIAYKDKKRNDFVKVILMAAFTNILVFIGTEFIFGADFDKELFTKASYSFLTAVAMVIAVIGSEVLWENIFGVLTMARLNDLTNPNKPVLTELHDKANGTYQHSLAVANIGEKAAQAIDANWALVRAAAYYHDIGKMKNPMYFAENQEGGDNPHTRELEGDSARKIREHVDIGCQRAKEENLPQVIIDMIRQHHGTTSVGHFYNKAVDNYGQENVDEKDYRYDNETPKTKESAILMLADSVEAATRAGYKAGKTKEELEEIVSNVMKLKLNDGQLYESGLSFKEFKIIEESFKTSIRGMYHSRVMYHKNYFKTAEELKGEKTKEEAAHTVKEETKTEAEVK